MYSVAAIKAAVTVASLGLGTAAVAVTVGIQKNPLLFTSAEAPAVEVSYVPREIPALPPPIAAVAIPEVQISATPQKFESKAAVQLAVKRLAVPKAVSAPAPKPEVIDPSEDRVIPAPCHDGEYRKLDETRGVRLMCPSPE